MSENGIQYVEKRCPNCDVAVEQVESERLWHWCEDGDKYELRSVGTDTERGEWTDE